MALDKKKILQLAEASQGEMKQLGKALNVDNTIQLAETIKSGRESEEELMAINPMLPSYLADIQKNLNFMLRTVGSVRTHVNNRSKELSGLQNVLK